MAIVRADAAAGTAAGTALVLYAAGRAGWWTRSYRPLSVLGRISYSLYLCHAFVGGLVYYRLKDRVGLNEATLWGLIGLMFALTIPAMVMYRVIEAPAIGWSRRVRVPADGAVRAAS